MTVRLIAPWIWFMSIKDLRTSLEICGSINCHFLGISGTRKITILVIYGSRNEYIFRSKYIWNDKRIYFLDQEIAKFDGRFYFFMQDRENMGWNWTFEKSCFHLQICILRLYLYIQLFNLIFLALFTFLDK